MKKIVLAILTMALLLSGCGKKEEVVVSYLDENTFLLNGQSGEETYEVTVEVRKNAAVDASQSVSYIKKHTEDGDYFYGTAGGGEYFRIISTSGGDAVTYLDDGFYEKIYTKDDYDLLFIPYDEAIAAFFNSENLSAAEEKGEADLTLKKVDRNWTENGITGNRMNFSLPEETSVRCHVYSLDTTGLKDLWDDAGAYDKMMTTYYVDENRQMVYAVMVLTFGANDKNGKTITLVRNGSDLKLNTTIAEYITLKDYELKRQGIAVADGGKTTLELVEVTEEEIANQTADGYYYEDGSYAMSKPSFERSWIRKEAGETIETYDTETDIHTDLVTGEVTAEYSKDGSHATDEIRDTDIYNMTFAQITNKIMGYSADRYYDWQYLCGYNYTSYPELANHPEGVPEATQELVEKIYNTYTVQYVIDNIKDMTEEEKIYIAFLAYNEDFTVQSTDKMTILFSDIVKASGLNISEYAMKRYDLWQDASTFYN